MKPLSENLPFAPVNNIDVQYNYIVVIYQLNNILVLIFSFSHLKIFTKYINFFFLKSDIKYNKLTLLIIYNLFSFYVFLTAFNI